MTHSSCWDHWKYCRLGSSLGPCSRQTRGGVQNTACWRDGTKRKPFASPPPSGASEPSGQGGVNVGPLDHNILGGTLVCWVIWSKQRHLLFTFSRFYTWLTASNFTQPLSDLLLQDGKPASEVEEPENESGGGGADKLCEGLSWIAILTIVVLLLIH